MPALRHIRLLILLALILPLRQEQAMAGSGFFGLILALSGEVLITRDIMEFKPGVEDSLSYDDCIETGRDGHVQLSFKSSFLSIGPDTIITICRKSGEKKETVSIQLEKGAFRSKILKMKAEEGYEIVTEKGSLQVSGTDFVTFFLQDESGLSVTVLDGTVSLFPAASQAEEAGRSGPGLPVGRLQSGGMLAAGSPAPISEVAEKRVSDLKKTFPLPGDDDEKPRFEVALNRLDIEKLEKGLIKEKIRMDRAVMPSELARVLSDNIKVVSAQALQSVVKEEIKTAEKTRFRIRFALEVGVSEL